MASCSDPWPITPRQLNKPPGKIFGEAMHYLAVMLLEKTDHDNNLLRK
jgi:hypothetical protein